MSYLNVSRRGQIWFIIGIICIIIGIAVIMRGIEGFTIKSRPSTWYGGWYDLFPTMPAIISRSSLEGLRDRGTPDTSHTIDLPLSNPISCKNSCAVGRCSKTGQQCLADIDCPGCNPYAATDTPFDVGAKSVPAANDAGKLTVGVTPTYSSLTTDMGSRAAVFNPNALGTAPPKGMLDIGGSPWRTEFDAAQELYDAKFRPKPGQYPFMPNYPAQPTTTGMFINQEPLPANY